MSGQIPIKEYQKNTYHDKEMPMPSCAACGNYLDEPEEKENGYCNECMQKMEEECL